MPPSWLKSNPPMPSIPPNMSNLLDGLSSSSVSIHLSQSHLSQLGGMNGMGGMDDMNFDEDELGGFDEEEELKADSEDEQENNK
ncbi:hypothetical protein FG379_001016 [Cryptosporidium bovis]|uniref:uncharacterized protein n=1 Tax=Cryptosporidium bovis TaxID=310047 RepID=UPI00351A9BE6|nr:hypothetical protein FG379_001016 [Cryptosporidium bovis]